jgi:hypothetical protein
MAINAGNLTVGIHQWEARCVMLRQSESGRFEPVLAVAGFAPIEIGLCFEPGFMNVAMTRGAGGLFDAVDGSGLVRNVALVAFRFRMAPPEREFRLVMLCNAECRGPESVDTVASAAVAAISPGYELLLMLILLVAIPAFRERKRAAHISG